MLEINASGQEVGARLSQKKDEWYHLIAYGSHLLSAKERELLFYEVPCTTLVCHTAIQGQLMGWEVHHKDQLQPPYLHHEECELGCPQT